MMKYKINVCLDHFKF